MAFPIAYLVTHLHRVNARTTKTFHAKWIFVVCPLFLETRFGSMLSLHFKIPIVIFFFSVNLFDFVAGLDSLSISLYLYVFACVYVCMICCFSYCSAMRVLSFLLLLICALFQLGSAQPVTDPVEGYTSIEQAATENFTTFV